MLSWNNAYTSTEKEILCGLDLDYTHDALIIELSKKHKENLQLIKRIQFYQNFVKKESRVLTDLKQKEKEVVEENEDIHQQIQIRRKIFEHALNWQHKQAKKLATQIEEDVEHTSYDFYKKEKYEKKAGLKEDENFTITTDHAHTALSWFTSIRLFLVRLNRVLSPFVKFLGKWFDLLGLSYGFELIIDIGVIFWSTFKPYLREPEKKLMEKGVSLPTLLWWRFKNVMLEDGRIPRMLNAAVWFSVNLSCILLTGGFSLLFHPIVAPHLAKLLPSFNRILAKGLNLGAFTFDVFNDGFYGIYRGIKNHFQSKKTLNIVEKKIEKLKAKKNQWKQENKDIQEIQKLKLKIQSRELIQAQLKEKINQNTITGHLYQLGAVISIVVGMSLVFFPPTLMVGSGFLIGGIIALLGGSVFGGLGKRLWNKMWDSLNSKGNKPKITNDINKTQATRSLQPAPAIGLIENSLHTSTTAQVISSFAEVTSNPQPTSLVPSEREINEENSDEKKSSKPVPIPRFKITSDNFPSPTNHPFFPSLPSPTNIGTHRSSGEMAPHTKLLLERSPECIMVYE